MCHTSGMAHERYTAHVGERGRLVVPAAVRRRLQLDQGDLLVIEEEEDRFVVRKAADVAHGFSGYLREVEPDRDLAAELITERREEVAHEAMAGQGIGHGRTDLRARRRRTFRQR
jgi:AbrB family looped-hinge helix DNA binding protein